MAGGLKRKVGPLPLWGWMAAVGLGMVLYFRHANAQKQGAVGPGMDPNTVDPNTGLTYGQEMGGGGFGAQPTTMDSGGGPQPTPVDLTGGFLSQLQGFEQILAALQALTQPATQTPSDTGDGGGKHHHNDRKRVKDRDKVKDKDKRGHRDHDAPPDHDKPPHKPRGHRVPNHPHEHVHGTHPGHFREPPAHRRIYPHLPKGQPRGRHSRTVNGHYVPRNIRGL